MAERRAVQYLVVISALSLNRKCDSAIPGCSVESIVFFASHSSGDMSLILPVLYAVTSCFAFSRPAADVNNVL